MKRILILGAGRSSSSLIGYLIRHSQKEDWEITVADISETLARKKTGDAARTKVLELDANDPERRKHAITNADLVISMLPAALHLAVARECLAQRKHMATASYVSQEMMSLHDEACSHDLVFLNEMGLDPGIDHMSAMEIIHRVQAQGAELSGFRSYCGGLVAPESNDNPWGYKFSWNPRNVILAGQGTAQFRENGVLRFIPYSSLFNCAASVKVPGYGNFDAYANRDSLGYLHHYGIQEVQTILRGTLRTDGFCKAWDALIRLGLTDDSWQLPAGAFRFWNELLNSFVPGGKGDLKQRTSRFLNIPRSGTIMKKLDWLGIFGRTPVRLRHGSPAQYLQDLLERKWKLGSRDKDMVVMLHEFEYTLKRKKYKISSSMVMKGQDQEQTAMAMTVGLPLAMGVKLILQNRILQRGVIIPVHPEIYLPVLDELRNCGISFREQVTVQKAR